MMNRLDEINRWEREQLELIFETEGIDSVSADSIAEDIRYIAERERKRIKREISQAAGFAEKIMSHQMPVTEPYFSPDDDDETFEYPYIDTLLENLNRWKDKRNDTI